jgi:hypothetical protein
VRPTILKTLTVREPWATAIMLGMQRVEYRSYVCPVGPLLIHSAVARPSAELLAEWPKIDPKTLVYGCILGVVRVVEVHPDEEAGWSWRLAEPLRFGKPIPAVGQLGRWRCKMTPKLWDALKKAGREGVA